MVSLGFWGCLLVSMTAYAAATLSGRWADHQRLREQYVHVDDELRQLATQVDRYRRHGDQLDAPAIDSPLARRSDAKHTVTVDSTLQFRLDAEEATTSVDAAAAPANVIPARLSDLAAKIDQSPFAQRGLLLFAGALMLFAFTTLVESPPTGEPKPRRLRRVAAAVLRPLGVLVGRYRSLE